MDPRHSIIKGLHFFWEIRKTIWWSPSQVSLIIWHIIIVQIRNIPYEWIFFTHTYTLHFHLTLIVVVCLQTQGFQIWNLSLFFNLDKKLNFKWKSSKFKLASTWEDLSLGFGNNRGADQPAYLGSLISAFVIHLLESFISKLAMSEFSISI